MFVVLTAATSTPPPSGSLPRLSSLMQAIAVIKRNSDRALREADAPFGCRSANIQYAEETKAEKASKS
jgi:hypothetical protein